MTNSSADRQSGPPLDEIYGDIQRITNIFHWFIALILTGLVAGMVIVLLNRDILPALLIAASFLPTLASLYLIRRKKFEPAAVFLAVILISLVTLTATKGLGIHHISILGYPAILIVASLVIRKRTMVFLTLYNVVCIAWLVFGELSGAYKPETLVGSLPQDFYSVTIILLMTAVMVRLISESLFQSNLHLQKELKERKLAEEKYRDMVENAIDGIFQSTPDGRFISVNSAMARMYGYDSPEDMIESIADISSQLYVEPDLRRGLLHRLTAGDRITGFESQEYRKDRSTFWTSMNIRVVREVDRNIPYYEGTVEDITDRKVAGEVLRESEERYRNLFNGMLDGIYRSSHDGKFLDVNAAMVKMFGYESREEMLAVDIKREMYFAPEERESLFLDTGQEKVDIFRMRRKDGSEIWVEDHGRYIHDEKGNVIYHEGILRDITPRMKIEAERESLIRELAARNAESETLRESLASIVGTFEFSEIIQRILDQIRRVIPYDSASVWRIEGNVQKFVSGRDLPAAFMEANVTYPLDDTNSAVPALRGEVPYILNNDVQEELPDFHEPPDDLIHSWLAIPLKTHGRIIGFIALDGHQKGQFNEHHAWLGVTFANQVAIALENARLFGETQQRADQLAILNEVGRAVSKLTDLNTVLETIYEQAKKSLHADFFFIGLYDKNSNLVSFPLMYDHGQRWDQPPAPVTDETLSGRTIRFRKPLLINQSTDILTGDSVKPVFVGSEEKLTESLIFAPLIFGEQVTGVISVQSYERNAYNQDDLNLLIGLANHAAIALENARLYSALQSELAVRERLVGELESKNTELERFTYTVSHDLKSPLVTINGFLGYLEADVIAGDVERARRDRGRIQDAVHKMQRLLNELLELSRIGRLMNQPQTIPFDELIKDALEIVHGQLEARGVTVQTQPGLPSVHGDRQRLTEVLQNLLDNAAKFMGDQTDARIEIGQRGEENGKPVFFVRDNGIGILPEHQEQVFGLFNKLDAQSEGTGIGLALVRRIVEVHGGRIWVESEADRGSTFYFTLSKG